MPFTLPPEQPANNKSFNPFPKGTGTVVFDQAKLTLTSLGLPLIVKKFQNQQEQTETDTPLSTSYIGTPVFVDVRLYLNSDTSFLHPVILQTVLVDVQREHNVIRTFVQGRDSSIKEYINLGDWTINFRGLLLSQTPDVVPLTDTKALEYMLTQNQSLVVVSNFLNNIFNIHQIVITSESFKMVEGMLNAIAYDFSAWSDAPLSLQLK